MRICYCARRPLHKRRRRMCNRKMHACCVCVTMTSLWIAFNVNNQHILFFILYSLFIIHSFFPSFNIFVDVFVFNCFTHSYLLPPVFTKCGQRYILLALINRGICLFSFAMLLIELARISLLISEIFHAFAHSMVLLGVLRPKREEISKNVAYFCVDTASGN